MKIVSFLLLIIIVVLISGFVCRSRDTVKAPAVPVDTLQKAPSGAGVSAPSQEAVMKANISRVKGTVQKVDLLDSLDFRIDLRIDSVFSIGDMLSLAEQGQKLTLAPRFVLQLNGGIDMANDRNRHLLLLRSRTPGASFSGKITLQTTGSWLVVDADSL